MASTAITNPERARCQLGAGGSILSFLESVFRALEFSIFRQEQQNATMFRKDNDEAFCAERGAVNQLARGMPKPRPSVCSVRYAGTRGIFGGRTELIEVLGTGIIEYVPKLPKGRVTVLSSLYRTIPECSVGYGGRTEPLFDRVNTRRMPLPNCRVPESAVVPDLQKCRVPVLRSYRTHRSVEYRYQVRTAPYRTLPECSVGL